MHIKNKEVEENTELSKRLKRYSKRDDEISKLVNSFVEMMKAIENYLSEIKKQLLKKKELKLSSMLQIISKHIC